MRPSSTDRRPVYFAPDGKVSDPRIDAGDTTLYGALKQKLVGQIGHSSAAAGWSQEVVAERWSLPATDSFEIRMARHRLVVLVGPSPTLVTWNDNGCKGKALNGAGVIHLIPQDSNSRTCWASNLDIISLEFSSALMTRLLDGRDAQGPSEQLVYRRNTPDAIAYRLAHCIRTELAMPTERLYGELLCLALSVHLLQVYGRARVSTARGRLSAIQAKRVLDYMHAHLDAGLSVSALARVAGLSDANFARAFRTTFNEPPHKVVLRWRLERAARLIRTKDASLAEIAAAAGFCDQAHFTNAMRRHFGKSPSKLLKS